MFDKSKVVTELKKVVGWEDHWNTTDIPPLGSPLNDSESDQYYQDFHEALRLDYIESLLAEDLPLTTYLDSVETKAITQVLNTIERKKKLKNVGKDISTSDIIFDVGRKKQTITNESRFVGVMFEPMQSVGYGAVLNRVGLYLTAAVTNLDLYLFHSSQEQVIATYQFTTTKNNSFSWQEFAIKLHSDVDTAGISGGVFYLGYYQDDLAGQSSQAVQYKSMNFKLGYCTGCGRNDWDKQYKSISSKLGMCGFYVPGASLPLDPNERFDNDVVVKTNSNNWGFNFNITIVCDMTQFWIDNRAYMVDVIGLSVAMRVLKMMKFSSQINNVEEGVKIMIIRDLEGATDTKNPPLNEMLDDAIEALILDQGNLNVACLPCARKPKTTYGAIG